MRISRFIPVLGVFLLPFHLLAETKDVAQKPTVFVVMRHGESDHNVRAVFNSRPDHPKYFESHLTSKGREQVSATSKDLLAKKVEVKNIYRGPLPRTIETSNILNTFVKAHNVKIDKRLIEAGAGDLEGLPNSTVKDNWGIDDIAKNHHGETRQEMRKRLCSFMKDMIANHSGETTAFVSHGSPSEMILNMLGTGRSRLNTGEAAVVNYTGTLKGCEGL